MATNLTAIISADTAGFVKNVREARQQLIDWANQAKDQSKDVKKATAEQVNAYIRVLDAMKKTTDGTKDTATATKQLTKQIQELKIQYANLSDEAKSGDFGRSMKRQIEQASAQLNKMNTQMRQVSTSMKTVGKRSGGGFGSMIGQVKQLGNLMGEFGVRGGGAVAEVAGSMEGLGATASKLGPLLANPYVAAAAAIAACIVELVNYDMKLQASLKKTSKVTGESGESLHQLRAGVQSLTDVYGSDYDKQLEATNALMQQFGVTGQEAVTAISNGLSQGVEDVDGYLDNVKELSGSFADAGVSAEDFTNMLTKVNQGLISEDSFKIMQNGFKNISKMESGMVNALSAIGVDANKLQADINSGAITTAEAMKQITDAIGQFPPASAEAQNAIRTCFEEEGQKAGYAMVTALGDVVDATNDTAEATSDYTNAIRQCQRADEELEQACDDVFSLGVDWDTFGAIIKNGCYTTLTQLVKIVGVCKDAIVVFCRTGYAWIQRLNNAIQCVVDAFLALTDLDFDKMLSKIKEAGKELYSMGTDYGNIAVEVLDGKGNNSKVNKQIKQQIDTISKQLDRAYKENKLSKAQYNKYLNDIKSANKSLNQNTVKGDNAAKAVLNKVSAGLSSINKSINKPTQRQNKISVGGNRSSNRYNHKTGSGGTNTKSDRDAEKLQNEGDKKWKETMDLIESYNSMINEGYLKGTSKNVLKELFATDIIKTKETVGITLSEEDKNKIYDKISQYLDRVKMPEEDDIWRLNIKDLIGKKNKFGFNIFTNDRESREMRSVISNRAPKSIYDKDTSLEKTNQEAIENLELWNSIYEQLDDLEEKVKEKKESMESMFDDMKLLAAQMKNEGIEPSQTFKDTKDLLETYIYKLEDDLNDIQEHKILALDKAEDIGVKQHRIAADIFDRDQQNQDMEDTIKMYGDLGSAVDSVSSAVNSMGDAFDAAGDKTIKTISGMLNAIGTMFNTISQMIPLINSITTATKAQTAASTGAAAANQTEAITAADKAYANAAATGAKAPWPIAAAMILTLVGTVMSALSGVASGFAGGGIIGGKTTVGDMNLARVNKGEMILNGRQQAHLFQVLDSGMTGGNVNIAGGSIRVKGSDLYVALKNYSKTSPNAKTL